MGAAGGRKEEGEVRWRGRGKSAFKHAIKLENPPFLDSASCADFAVYLIQAQQAHPGSKGRAGGGGGKRVSATKPHSVAAASNRNRSRGSSGRAAFP